MLLLMRVFILFLTVLLSSFVASAQIQDDFSDGDFTNGSISLCTMDKEVLCELEEFCESEGYTISIRQKERTAPSYRIVDPERKHHDTHRLHNIFRNMGLMGKKSIEKHIPEEYLVAPAWVRAELLSGLIDSDGWLEGNGATIEWTSSSWRLARDTLRLAKSLGIRGNITIREAFIGDKQYTDSNRIHFSGNLGTLNLRVPRRVPNESAYQKNHLVMGFKTEKLPEDDFYGFSLSGDHLYVDSNFVIHHNTGKAPVQAFFVRTVMDVFPNQRVICATHVKELVAQNANTMSRIWPGGSIGVNSAGLKKRNFDHSVVFAGIGSIAKYTKRFGHIDLLIIDEAHRVNYTGTTQYKKLIDGLLAINPKMKIIGLTATPWRAGQGHLIEAGLFTDVAYDNTKLEDFNKLVYDGYLMPLIPRDAKTEIDLSNVHIQGGEYVQKELQTAVDKTAITEMAVDEIINEAAIDDRKCWLVFTTGIEHTEHVTARLREKGVNAEAVHSGNKDYPMSSGTRDNRIVRFTSGETTCIVNGMILTVGFDHPPIDLIAYIRPTLSSLLWIQAMGRGTRPYFVGDHDLSTRDGRLAAIEESGVFNCKVLDFGRNTYRLGPINDPVIPNKKGKSKGEAPVKKCEPCGTINHAGVKFCINCGNEFLFESKIHMEASTDDLIKNDIPIIDVVEVHHITYDLHKKIGKPPMMKVCYYNKTMMYNEWVCFEHTNYAGTRAKKWWKQHSKDDFPTTTKEGLSLSGKLKTPTHIRVWTNKQFPEIMAHCYDGTGFGSLTGDQIVENPKAVVQIPVEEMFDADDIPF